MKPARAYRKHTSCPGATAGDFLGRQKEKCLNVRFIHGSRPEIKRLRVYLVCARCIVWFSITIYPKKNRHDNPVFTVFLHVMVSSPGDSNVVIEMA